MNLASLQNFLQNYSIQNKLNSNEVQINRILTEIDWLKNDRKLEAVQEETTTEPEKMETLPPEVKPPPAAFSSSLENIEEISAWLNNNSQEIDVSSQIDKLKKVINKLI